MTFSIRADGQLYVSAEPPPDELILCKEDNEMLRVSSLLAVALVLVGLYALLKYAQLLKQGF